jgi:hypothetical protein
MRVVSAALDQDGSLNIQYEDLATGQRTDDRLKKVGNQLESRDHFTFERCD